MAGGVVVIASGATERNALPPLCRHLEKAGVKLLDVRIPPAHRPLKPKLVSQIVQLICSGPNHESIDKIVVLVDTDASEPDTILAPIRAACGQLRNISIPVLVTPAIRHLEAWFFADSANLRLHLGDRALGPIASDPDSMPNPKLTLRALMRPGHYTAFTAGEIARRLNVETMNARSASFRQFLGAMRNGGALGEPG